MPCCISVYQRVKNDSFLPGSLPVSLLELLYSPLPVCTLPGIPGLSPFRRIPATDMCLEIVRYFSALLKPGTGILLPCLMFPDSRLPES